MGRFNKRLAAAKMVKADKLSLSSSSVLKTAAKKELEVPVLSKPAQMQTMHETASSLKPRYHSYITKGTYIVQNFNLTRERSLMTSLVFCPFLT